MVLRENCPCPSKFVCKKFERAWQTPCCFLNKCTVRSTHTKYTLDWTYKKDMKYQAKLLVFPDKTLRELERVAIRDIAKRQADKMSHVLILHIFECLHCNFVKWGRCCLSCLIEWCFVILKQARMCFSYLGKKAKWIVL